MGASTRETVAAREPSRSAGRPEQVRVALVVGSGAAIRDDLHRLLRRRLLVMSTFLAACSLFMALLGFLRGPNPELDYNRTYGEIAVATLPMFALIAIHATSAGILWRRPPRSVFALRAIEVVVFGAIVARFLALSVQQIPYLPLEWASHEADPQVASAYVGRYANGGAVIWTLLMTLYGMLIPNTLRRAVVVILGIAASPIVLFIAWAWWVRPLAPEVRGDVVFVLSTVNAIAAAMVLIGTSRIEFYRRQASASRTLGQYLLKDKLGAGGMGEVYRAEHALLRRPCALKLIRPEREGDDQAIRRFEREVQITATLTHPNTIQIYDYGRAEDGTFYYVMEYLPGLTLDDLVRRHGPLPASRVAHFLRQIVAALGEAHARGLIHRDIKPGNVMVGERGGVCDVVKLLDFGLVRMPGDDPGGATLTREGTIAGTPAYMSPEQAGGELDIDSRSDLYSVGALAYFLLTGRPPFADRTPAKVVAAHLYETPAPLPSAVPADLAAIVTRCLAKPPADRWPDAETLGVALAGLSCPPWTDRDAGAWWGRMGSPGRSTGPASETTTWGD